MPVVAAFRNAQTIEAKGRLKPSPPMFEPSVTGVRFTPDIKIAISHRLAPGVTRHTSARVTTEFERMQGESEGKCLLGGVHGATRLPKEPPEALRLELNPV